MIIAERDVTCLVPGDALLGEGPVWVAREAALYWVDIEGPTIFRWSETTGVVDRWVPPFQVASLVPARDGGFIAGTAHGFAYIDPAKGHYKPVIHPESDMSGNRFNDGKPDRLGRFWAGTMDDAKNVNSGALYRLDTDLTTTRTDDGYGVTNGPAFNRSGGLMYHTDSAAQTIYVFDMDDKGRATGKRVFRQFEDGHGYPDGMTVDADDCLWVAFWDGGCLRRFAPDGEQLDETMMPVPRPTSCTFGGSDMASLFVTSARTGLAPDESPLSGSLFALRPGVRGIPDMPFAGNFAQL